LKDSPKGRICDENLSYSMSFTDDEDTRLLFGINAICRRYLQSKKDLMWNVHLSDSVHLSAIYLQYPHHGKIFLINL